MKADMKKPKRTPSFTTRRRTQSFRKLQKFAGDSLELPPVEIQGVLDRKHELQRGGKKAPIRSWKTFYTVLCGQLLCFFKDQDDFIDSKAATSPIIIYNAKCEKAEDYTKRKHVFRLCCTDGSEFLFLAPSAADMEDWVNKITFHAQLEPSNQLMRYDDGSKGSPGVDRLAPVGPEESSDSSRDSTPESTRRGKPPIPPRSAPPPIPTMVDRIPPHDVTDGGQMMNPATRPRSYQPPLRQDSAHNGNPPHEWRNSSPGTMDMSPVESPPPLPASAPPNRGIRPIPAQLPARDPWPTDNSSYKHGTVYANLAHKPTPHGRTVSTLPLQNDGTSPGSDRRRPSESSSENEQQQKEVRKDKRPNVLSSFFRKKKTNA